MYRIGWLTPLIFSVIYLKIPVLYFRYSGASLRNLSNFDKKTFLLGSVGGRKFEANNAFQQPASLFRLFTD